MPAIVPEARPRLPLRRRHCLRHDEGGGPCVRDLDRPSPTSPRTPTADLSRWTHRVGVTGRGCERHPHLGTPSDLARLSAAALDVAIGELSPWRSVLPPRTCR